MNTFLFLYFLVCRLGWFYLSFGHKLLERILSMSFFKHLILINFSFWRYLRLCWNRLRLVFQDCLDSLISKSSPWCFTGPAFDFSCCFRFNSHVLRKCYLLLSYLHLYSIRFVNLIIMKLDYFDYKLLIPYNILLARHSIYVSHFSNWSQFEIWIVPV